MLHTLLPALCLSSSEPCVSTISNTDSQATIKCLWCKEWYLMDGIIYTGFISYTNSNMLSVGLLETRMIGNVSQYHKTFSKMDNNVMHRWNQVMFTC